jgi:hypothetical protein
LDNGRPSFCPEKTTSLTFCFCCLPNTASACSLNGTPVLDPSLHTGGGDGPHACGHVDFGPHCPDYLPGTGGGQDGELKGSCRAAVTLPQVGHELGDLAVRQSSMMLHSPNLSGGGEGFLQVSFPSCRIISETVASDGCEIQHRFNAPAQSARRLGLCAPDRIEHPDYETGIDRRNREIPKDGISVSPKCGLPLGRILPLLQEARWFSM